MIFSTHKRRTHFQNQNQPHKEVKNLNGFEDEHEYEEISLFRLHHPHNKHPHYIHGSHFLNQTDKSNEEVHLDLDRDDNSDMGGHENNRSQIDNIFNSEDQVYEVDNPYSGGPDFSDLDDSIDTNS